MGLKDKLKGGLRALWSPITVWMADEGSDRLVHAGGTARVVVAVQGEDDGTAERVDVELVLTGSGLHDPRSWPLGQVPAVVGPQQLTAAIPAGVPPSCAQYAEYSFRSTLHRTKGSASSASVVVDVVGRPEDLYWPDGPRAGSDGAGPAWLQVTLDTDIVPLGSPVTGRVSMAGDEGVSVVLGALITSPQSPNGKFKEVGRAQLTTGQSFSLLVPEGVPPTLHNGGASSVCWQIRASLGDATAWHWVGVVDPEGKAGIRDRPSPGLLSWLGSMDSSPRSS